LSEHYNDINNDLLVKYLLGESSGNENRVVEAWIASDPSNKKYFDHFKLIWDESKTLASYSEVNTEAAWKRFNERIKNPAAVNPVVKRMNPRLQWMRVAALCVVVAASALAFYLYQSNKEVETMTVRSSTTIVNDTLPDGSIVILNKNSLISFPEKFSGDTRLVALKGEAFFNITPNKNKPFIIHVNDVEIKVLGTSFNVRQVNGKTEVIVESGIVQVVKDQKTVRLKPKEKTITSWYDSSLVKVETADRLYNYYHSKEFVCSATPLQQLVETLNAAYDSNIIIENDSLRDLKITTVFKNESLDTIISIISETLKIKVDRKGKTIILN
jgi:ferric-dicitrate binding protein FerR (iron transport regulator)